MQLLGINFYQGTYQECLRNLENKAQNGTKTLVVTPNPEILSDAKRDPELLNTLQSADIATPDGAGVFVAFQISDHDFPKWKKWMYFPFWCVKSVIHNNVFKQKYGERITGARLTGDLVPFAAENNIPIIILDPVVNGNNPGDIAKRKSQEAMKQTLEKKFSGLNCKVIIGDTSEGILNQLNSLDLGYKKAIVFATHGGGKQEKILAEIMKSSDKISLALGIGGSIDILTGFRAPAPAVFRRLGCEWLYRLMKHPKKHWKRMKKVMGFLGSMI